MGPIKRACGNLKERENGEGDEYLSDYGSYGWIIGYKISQHTRPNLEIKCHGHKYHYPSCVVFSIQFHSMSDERILNFHFIFYTFYFYFYFYLFIPINQYMHDASYK